MDLENMLNEARHRWKTVYDSTYKSYWSRQIH